MERRRGSRQRQPGFAHAPQAEDCQQAHIRIGQMACYLGQLQHPPDKGRGLHGEIVQRPG